MQTYLQPWRDGEATSRGVHARHILTLVDLFQRQFSPIVPMTVIHVLSDQRMRLHCTVCVDLWHVHVVHKVDQFLVARWTKVTTCLLL